MFKCCVCNLLKEKEKITQATKIKKKEIVSLKVSQCGETRKESGLLTSFHPGKSPELATGMLVKRIKQKEQYNEGM